MASEPSEPTESLARDESARPKDIIVESSSDNQSSDDRTLQSTHDTHTPTPKVEPTSLLFPDAAKPRTLPLPAASVNPKNPSQTSFVLPDASSSNSEPLPPEVARAEISIAADGSFVQTPSALAARELKKRYDSLLRVGQGIGGQVIRSPYAITVVKDVSGRQLYRISDRTESVSAETPPSQPSSSYTPGHAAGPRRRARLSVHDFLQSSMFKLNTSSGAPPRNASSVALGSGSTPPMNGLSTHTPRKLRKSRSNSDLHLRSSSSPPQAGASTAIDSGHLSPPLRAENFTIEIRDEVTAGADAFSQVLGWSSELATDSVASSRKSVKSSVPPTPDIPPNGKEGSASGAITEGSLSRPASISTSAALSGADEETSNAPFGENVHYTAPTRLSAIYLASQPPQLREMQSFESGLTARAGDDREAVPGTPKSKSKQPKRDEKNEENEAFLAAKSRARYPTTVFEVLQTYRGLPLPTALSELATGATIKLSFTDNANPKDDPRFVIWGEIQPDGAIVDEASLSRSQSRSSHTDLSASAISGTSASGSRKRSNARPPNGSNDPPQVALQSESSSKTLIIAATVERWIAQLTSELNYDELLNFLLTYRTYIPPVDLCHLLICRFHWALETPSSRQDDMVKRIVRVRTFNAIRYWLLTFFREDFLPNSELCQLFTSWLNALFRDPALIKYTDALIIVRKLKKIVRECKAAHSRHGRSGVGRPSMDPGPAPYPSLNGVLGDLAQGVPTSSTRVGGDRPGEEYDDPDVDLDFSPQANDHYTEYASGDGTINPLDQTAVSAANQPLRSQPPIAIPPVQARSTATPSANSILLSQPLSATILGHVKSAAPGTDTPLTQTPASLPAQHSAISRAFVNTIGRLGRWKRVLNSRSSVPTPHCGDLSVFDLEPNAGGDLLAIHGGVEEYLKMLNLSPPISSVQVRDNNVISGPEKQYPVRPPGLESPVKDNVDSAQAPLKTSRPSVHLDALNEEGEENENDLRTQPTQTRDSETSFLTGSEITEETHRLSSEISIPTNWEPEIVSLDDYDLSDSDSSSHSPARARRLPRRLPLRRDFHFVRRSVESVSSMGIQSHSSLASSIRSGSESIRSGSQSSTSVGPPLVTGIQSWQIDLIDSDDEEEAGDAEAALRRLEGQIDADRQREKDLKVGRWLKTAHQQVDRDGASSIHSGSQFSEPEDLEEEEDREQPDNEDVTVSVASARPSLSHEAENGRPMASEPTSISVGTANQPITERDRSGSVGSSQMPLLSRPPSRPTSSTGMARRPSLLGRTSRAPAPSKFGSPHVPPAHRSFILMYRSETLAQQFAIIEAELFAKVKFEELISHQWGQSLQDVNVRDWVLFVKERAKLKNTGKPVTDPAVSAKLSAILALRARFDLLVNFTSSEVLLTHTSERVMVVEKFIRIAWKAYRHNNFSTLVALIAGLQTRWVNQAMSRHWHKIGIWEQRVFDDLKKFISRPGCFKYLRNATSALVDARPLGPGAQDVATAKTTGGAATSSKSRTSESLNELPVCVPFLGVYLSQLYEYERLPDYIDPTAPAEPVIIDPETGTLSPPSRPDVFCNLQSLPKGLDVEPLANVHKQRLIAGVIKSFVAGQHLATNIHFEVDQKSYQKCFRLRSLEPEALHSIAISVSDS